MDPDVISEGNQRTLMKKIPPLHYQWSVTKVTIKQSK